MRSLIVVALLVAGLSACGKENRSVLVGGPTPTPVPGSLLPDRIEVRSGPTLVITDPSSSTVIDVAVVTASGVEMPDELLTFRSSEPDLISVMNDGRVVLASSLPTSARVTISSGDLAPVEVLVAVAKLRSNVVVLDPSDIISREAFSTDTATRTITLARGPRTEVIVPGTVLAGPEILGLADTVLSVELSGDVIILRTELASLVDIFEELDVSAASTPQSFEFLVTEDGFEVVSGDVDQLISSEPLIFSKSLSCDRDLEVASVGVKGLTLNPTFVVRPVSRDRLFNGQVNRELGLESTIGIRAGIGALDYRGGVTLSATCSKELPKIKLVGAPLPWGFSIGGIVAPSLMFTTSISGNLSGEITGPSFSRSTSRTVGLRYRSIDDWSFFNSESSPPGGYVPLRAPLDDLLTGTAVLEAAAGPQLVFSPAFLFLGVDAGSFDMLDASAVLEGDLSLSPPFSSQKVNYRGPVAEGRIASRVTLSPFLERLEPAKKALDRAGFSDRAVDRIGAFVAANVTLVEKVEPIYATAMHVMQVVPDRIAVDTAAEIRIQGVPGGSVVRVLAFEEGTNNAPVEIARGTAASDGTLVSQWTPTADDVGTFSLNAVFADTVSPFDVGLGDSSPIVTVGDEPTLSIDPANISAGMVDEIYDFNVRLRGVGDGAGPVSFSWAFGDGTTGSAPADIVDGEAAITISHAYASQGGFGVVVVAKDNAGVTIDQATAVVSIGSAIERDIVLDVCNVWKAAGSGGFGATVDNWDISQLPQGAAMDIRFDAFTIPDRYLVEYPGQGVVLDTGWRGDFTTSPLYPGGVSGPGFGFFPDIFVRSNSNDFRVTVIGPDQRTAWNYEVRCRFDDPASP